MTFVVLLSLFLMLYGCGGGGDGGSNVQTGQDESIVDSGNVTDPDPGNDGDSGNVADPDSSNEDSMDDSGNTNDPDDGSTAGSGNVTDPTVPNDGSPSLPGNAPPVSDPDPGTVSEVGAGLDGTVAGVEYVDSAARANTVDVYEPMILDQPDTRYVLQADIITPGTGFEIQASNVTLDLNGHTLTYAQQGGAGPYYGVAVMGYNRKDVAIINGDIIQGAGALASDTAQAGWNPIHSNQGLDDFEIAGLYIEYVTPETYGVNVYYGGNGEIHHNEINDQGSVIINRHQSIVAIRTSGADSMKIHHNLISRARHCGLGIGDLSEVYENEIYIDSHATNSYGIMMYGVKGIDIYSNTIVGEGEHPIGIGMVALCEEVNVHSNYIEVQNTRAGAEYGSSGSSGLTIRWGGDQIEVWNNHFVLRAEADLLGPGLDSWGRAIWVSLDDFERGGVTYRGSEMRANFRQNTIVAENSRGAAKAAAIAVVAFNKSPNLVFEENLVQSNYAHVLLADDYGESDGFPKFIRNVFRKTNDFPSYRTVKSEYRSIVSTGAFFDNVYENGADFENMDLEFDGNALKEVRRGHMVDLNVLSGAQPVSGAQVRVLDESGREVFSGTTGTNGIVSIPVVDYRVTNQPGSVQTQNITEDYLGAYADRVESGPSSVEISHGGRTQTFPIDSGSRTMEVSL